MAKDIDGAEYWRGRAEEARAAAHQMQDADTRATMLRIAERYEAMARRAEEVAPDPPPRKK